MKISFIGAGSIAQAHFDALKIAGAEVVSVNTRGETGEAFAKSNNIKYFSDPEEMLKESSPDAVFLLTPPAAYLDILKNLKPFNLPTFLEKPLALTTAEAEELREYLPSTCFVGLNRRFYSNVIPIKEICDKHSGVLYELVLPERTKDYVNRPLEERNFWPMLNGIHCIDLITHLAGRLDKVNNITSWGEVACSDNPQYTLASYQTNKGNNVSYVSNLDSSGGWRIHIHLKQEQITLSPIETTIIKTLSGLTELELSEDDKNAKQGFVAQAKCFLEGAKSPDKLPANWVSFDEALESMKVVEKLHPPIF